MRGHVSPGVPAACGEAGAQVVRAGAVVALMQLQSLAYHGPFREAARLQLAALAAAHPQARLLTVLSPHHCRLFLLCPFCFLLSVSTEGTFRADFCGMYLTCKQACELG